MEVVKEEVEKLKQSGAIKEVFYPDRLANTVVMKKKNGKWRFYVDFTNLNRACPNDPYLVSKIDQLVDATYGHLRISFLDTFQGYHQIALTLEDQEKTSFISLDGNYHYTVIPFGLKNTRATYQRMITHMFKDKIGKTMEVYINDMVVKSKKPEEHVQNLAKVFEILRYHKLCHNASKCAFRMGSEKFFGYMTTCKGIEVNPNQIRAIQQFSSPNNPKKVQKLTGMLATLNCFVSRSAGGCRPLFQLLKKWMGFKWTPKCSEAFQNLKQYLVSPSILSSLKLEENLYIYLVVSNDAVSVVLIRVQKGIQKPVYYVSKTLVDLQTQYLPLEKMSLALVHATRKLQHYFQAHIVYILTKHPLQALLQSFDFTRRIAK